MIKRNETGITLVALVVTIVILLILAGITLVYVLGDNGVFKIADNARGKQKEAEYLEQINMAVLNSKINETHKINTNVLENALNQIKGITKIDKAEDGNLPWIVSTKEGYKFQIKEDGTIETVNGISLEKTNIKLQKGETQIIVAKLTDGVTGTITWTSSNTEVVTVDDAGKVTAVGASGTVTITARVTTNGKTYEASCTVTVIQPVTSISAKDVTVEEGSTNGKIQVETEPKENIEELEFQSDNDTVKIDSDGNITAGLIEGSEDVTATVTITGKISGKSTTCIVTVKKNKAGTMGTYVKYEVAYTDTVVNTLKYTETNGWRLLNATPNGDGSYREVELMSTGVPATVYMRWDSTAAHWWVNANDVDENGENLLEKFKTLLRRFKISFLY